MKTAILLMLSIYSVFSKGNNSIYRLTVASCLSNILISQSHIAVVQVDGTTYWMGHYPADEDLLKPDSLYGTGSLSWDSSIQPSSTCA